MINVSLNLNAVAQAVREWFSNSSSENEVDRRTYNRRDMLRRSSGNNQRARLLLDVRTAVYQETRKGDLEAIDVRPSVFHALEKAVRRPLAKWGFSDRFTGKAIPSQAVATKALAELHRLLEADQRQVARVGDIVDSLINTIWKVFVVTANDRRLVERRQVGMLAKFRPTANCLPEPLTA